MNRIVSIYPPADSGSSVAVLDFPAAESAAMPAMIYPSAQPAPAELMTRRIMPGTSIRRLRNHRCAWPRRAS